MTDEQQERIVNEALLCFVIYLNAWWNFEPMNEDERSPYTVEKFTITDYEEGLYGHTDWEVLKEVNPEYAFDRGLMLINTTDGDEGGGSRLYVCFDEDHAIEWIVHEFDLQADMIFHGNLMRTPPEGKMMDL